MGCGNSKSPPSALLPVQIVDPSYPSVTEGKSKPDEQNGTVQGTHPTGHAQNPPPNGNAASKSAQDDEDEDERPLEEQLTEIFVNNSNKKLAENPSMDFRGAYQRIYESEAKRITLGGAGVNDKFPAFRLMNQDGQWKNSSEILPAVINFFRGSWCLTCNKTLKHFSKHSMKFQEKGFNVVALAPAPTSDLKMLKAKHGLQFDLIYDKECEIANQLNISFEFSDELNDLYDKMGASKREFYGTDKLLRKSAQVVVPTPATYIVDKDHVIRWKYNDIWHIKRADARDIMRALLRIVD